MRLLIKWWNLLQVYFREVEELFSFYTMFCVDLVLCCYRIQLSDPHDRQQKSLDPCNNYRLESWNVQNVKVFFLVKEYVVTSFHLHEQVSARFSFLKENLSGQIEIHVVHYASYISYDTLRFPTKLCISIFFQFQLGSKRSVLSDDVEATEKDINKEQHSTLKVT